MKRAASQVSILNVFCGAASSNATKPFNVINSCCAIFRASCVFDIFPASSGKQICANPVTSPYPQILTPVSNSRASMIQRLCPLLGRLSFPAKRLTTIRTTPSGYPFERSHELRDEPFSSNFARNIFRIAVGCFKVYHLPM